MVFQEKFMHKAGRIEQDFKLLFIGGFAPDTPTKEPF